jgi:hypothetical protein
MEYVIAVLKWIVTAELAIVIGCLCASVNDIAD